ncbi:SDR family oxidoreductase [Rhizobium leguminosarum bv. viciae]|nr:SDR family NAD(P)-dependent oxidoreductase [Rhizobium leguminosarum]TBY76256.1 SDR family oxidoreductase [Rhizobium leguminosarum bv. viciae]
MCRTTSPTNGKTAVTAFTQNFACDYAPDKIGVNAVCPGEIHTLMHDAVICALADA